MKLHIFGHDNASSQIFDHAHAHTHTRAQKQQH